jgi:hypothetical protein
MLNTLICIIAPNLHYFDYISILFIIIDKEECKYRRAMVFCSQILSLIHSRSSTISINVFWSRLDN